VDPENIKEVMEELDKNHDGEVNFREFSQCICGLARAYYMKKHGKETGRGGQDKWTHISHMPKVKNLPKYLSVSHTVCFHVVNNLIWR